MENYDGLYSICLRRLREIKSESEIIEFPKVFNKLCRNFSIKKQECWKLLRFLKENKIIEISCGHGIRINAYSPTKVLEVLK